ncbi:uncharacterized protein LOC111909995 [Lactuca sativa]|uniref:Uncharacterized protein n=1 Tax=Lactuca sativa TaxID=4236 RepID=A0A9R1VU71_LACSA|nr:uncharacterized protein LOC111909995 [Lactuca sativa]KAJ0210945.1 hypothetical protein LSAT_V11C400217480 [Lactuca sativa]
MICGTQLLVPFEWKKNRFTMNLTCTKNCCNKKLKLKNIKPARFEHSRDSLAILSIEGEWKIKKFYLDAEKINGKKKEFTTKNGGDREEGEGDWDEEEERDMEPQHESEFDYD